MKTILICDSKNYMSRFLKFKFRCDYNFIKYSKSRFIKDLRSQNIALIIFVVYEDLDLIYLFDMLSTDKPLIVASENISLLNLLCGNLDLITVDLNRIKTDVYDEFETKITLLLKDY